MLADLLTSARFCLASLVLLSGGYTAFILGGAALIAPEGRLGSLIEHDGQVIGSSLIAQSFERNDYLWPRPSAVDYAADAAGGSNLSPANPEITGRARETLTRLGATDENPAPAELVLASGAGLDPHITLEAALYQAERIASARGADRAEVVGAIESSAATVAGVRLVNVLETNMMLDERFAEPREAR